MRGFGLTSVSWILWIALVASGGGACSSKGLVGGTGGGGGDATGETGGRGFGGGGDTGGSPPGTGGGGGDAGAGFLGDAGGGAGSGGAGSGGAGSGGAGSGGAGSGGAGTGTGGAVCPPPLSQFGCRATYDEQVASGICLSSGLITYGPCGSGWDWHCSSIWSDDCLYDANKSLLGAKHCDDAPNRFCSMCYQSSGYMTDGGPACSTGTLGD